MLNVIGMGTFVRCGDVTALFLSAFALACDVQSSASSTENEPSNVHEEFVTSSGTSNGFETYDFDYFTDSVHISAVFTSTGQPITISEVR